MKLTVNRKQFSEAFGIAAAVAAKRSVKPVLCDIRFDAAKEPPQMIATDYDVYVRVKVKGIEIKEPGEVMLPKDRLSMILANSSDEYLLFDSDGDSLRIEGKESRFDLPLIPVEGFTDQEPPKVTGCYRVSAAAVREMIKHTAYATDKESTRYTLSGVYLDFAEEGVVSAVATDGRRLARLSSKCETIGNPTGNSGVIVDSRVTNLVARCFGCESIDVAYSDNQVLFSDDDTALSARLPEGRFPKWRNIYPDLGSLVAADFIAGELKQAVRQAAAVASEAHPGVDFRFKKNRLVITANGDSKGMSRIQIPVVWEAFECLHRYDPDCLCEFLGTLDSTKKVTGYFGKEKPIFLSGADNARVLTGYAGDPLYFHTEDGYEYILMPMETPLTTEQGAENAHSKTTA